MWDPGRERWFRDEAHRFGARYGPTGDREYDIGPVWLHSLMWVTGVRTRISIFLFSHG